MEFRGKDEGIEMDFRGKEISGGETIFVVLIANCIRKTCTQRR